MMMRVNMNDVNSQRKNFKGGKENNKIWESVPVMIVFFSDCSSIDMMENNIFWNKIEKKVFKILLRQIFITAAQRLVLGYCRSRGGRGRRFAFLTLLTSISEC